MAPGHGALGLLPPKPVPGLGGALTAEEIHHIQECEKLLHFRDEVVSGVHPRIKPTHLTAKLKSPSSSKLPTPTPTTAQHPQDGVNGNGYIVDNMRSFQANLQQPPVSASPQGRGASSSNGTPTASSGAPAHRFGSSKAEIDPVLLEKSDDLIKAELRLQRARLELSLKEQVDQHRASTRAAQHAPEPVSDIGLADVLSKALALVQSTAAQPTDDTAANASAASDSFDDNTFYSSQHDTPEPSPKEAPPASSVPNVCEDEQMRDGSPYEPELDPPTAAPTQTAPVSDIRIPTEPRSHTLFRQEQAAAQPQTLYQETGPEPSIQNEQSNVTFRIPGLQTIQPAQASSARDAGDAGQPDAPRSMGRRLSGQYREQEANRQMLDEPFSQQAPPVIRAHNLSPVAPQPAHVSPLAVARHPPSMAQQQEPPAHRATPAQVAALRKGASAATSPESSPQSNRPVERKKGKKKKRKSDKQGGEAAVASPFIKTEPRSPSPFTSTTDPRPAKRQRQTQTQRRPGQPGDDESRYEQPVPVDDGVQERYPLRSYRDERGLARNDAQGILQARHVSQPVVIAAPRYGREYYEERPEVSPQFVRPASPIGYPVEYGRQGEVRVIRTASRADLERPYRDAPVQYHDPRDAPRMSMRSGTGRERSRSPVIYERPVSVMPPPRAPPTRIFIDEFGREYLEPARPTPVIRHSVVPSAPPTRAGEPEIIYERSVPPRAASRRPDSLEDNAILYRRSSPPSYVSQRRVVTQPELGGPDYRTYREREYSVRPMAPPGEPYAPSRPHPEGRVLAEPQYIARAPAGGRPAGEGIRYEVAGGYDRRVGGEPDGSNLGTRAASAMPAEAPRYEAPPHGYERRVVEPQYVRAASVRPAEPVRYEFAGGYGSRVGSVRPPDVPGREYAASVRPEARREVIQPSTEGHSFGPRLVEASPPVARQEYRLRPTETYYDRPVLRGGEEIVYMDPPPPSRPDAYQQAPRGHP